MANLDEAVVNLERFIGKVVEATGTLGDVSEHLEEKAREFAKLEDSAEQDGDTVTGHLDEALAAVAQGAGEAEDALAELENAAGEGERALGESKDQVEQTASDLEDKVRTAVADVDEAHGSLSSDGFQALGQTLDDLEQEMDAEAGETAQALNAMETDVQGFAKEAEAAWQEAEAAVDAAVAEIATQESDVEKEATEGTSAFEAAAVQVEAQCTSIDQELEALYATLESTVESEGGHWEQAVQDLGQTLLAFLRDGERERLEEPAALLDDQALDALDREYGAVEAGLGAAESTATELSPLADELVRSQSVVGQVDELMNSIGG